jgi:hypothetical protein
VRRRAPRGLDVVLDTRKRPGAARALKVPLPGTSVMTLAGAAPSGLYTGFQITAPRHPPVALLFDFMRYAEDLAHLAEHGELTLVTGAEPTPLPGFFTADAPPRAITIEFTQAMRRSLYAALEQCAVVALEAVQR